MLSFTKLCVCEEGGLSESQKLACRFAKALTMVSSAWACAASLVTLLSFTKHRECEVAGLSNRQRLGFGSFAYA